MHEVRGNIAFGLKKADFSGLKYTCRCLAHVTESTQQYQTDLTVNCGAVAVLSEPRHQTSASTTILHLDEHMFLLSEDLIDPRSSLGLCPASDLLTFLNCSCKL